MTFFLAQALKAELGVVDSLHLSK